MTPRRSGSLRLFQAFGIDVYVHWSWFIVAWLFYLNASAMGGEMWFVVTYVTLFGIVLMHEFGHALACRSVKGKANLIVLWPLGGVAYVEPPPRPGPSLWSIVAGPLVNLVLVPVTVGLAALAAVATSGSTAGGPAQAGVVEYLNTVALMNAILLVFNILPIYPLDGGQMLHSVLWFFMGWARALRIAATIGLTVGLTVAAVLVVSGAALEGEWILFAIALFVAFQAWTARKAAMRMVEQEETSRQNLERRAREMADPIHRTAHER